MNNQKPGNMKHDKKETVPISKNYEKNTRWQHFYSCAELKMNAVDPNAKREDAVIYKFRIIEPDPPKIQLVNDNPVKVEEEMAFEDLFTFDRSNFIRKNFERFFEEYETEINKVVKNLEIKLKPLLAKIDTDGHADITHLNDFDSAIFNIWTLKFINIGRNPYGVRKFRNSLPPNVQNYYPTDPTLSALYDKILELNENDVSVDMKTLGITLEEYKLWLRALFLLFLPSRIKNPITKQPFKSMMEQTAYELLHDRDHFCAAGIHVLTEEFPGRYLVSDRSYFYSSNEPENMTLHFNITQRLALTFMMVKPDSLQSSFLEEQMEFADNSEKEIFEYALGESRREISETLQKRIFVNDAEWSKWFNEATIFQAREHVFCSQKQVLGAKVLSAQ
jgi:hypothetical protein